MASPEAPKRILGGQCRYLTGLGYRGTVVASPGAALDAFADEEGVAVEAIAIDREVSTLNDLVWLWQLASTLCQVIIGYGVEAGDHPTPQPFLGSPN